MIDPDELTRRRLRNAQNGMDSSGEWLTFLVTALVASILVRLAWALW